MWRYYNPNPKGARVGDCTVRAICAATGKSWDDVYTGITLDGYLLGDMPSANHVWGAYLRRNGWKRQLVCEECDGCTVADFAAQNPHGTFVMAISGHVVTIIDGDWYDTWDSGEEIPIYYWTKER